jgi:hypothetical protein
LSSNHTDIENRLHIIDLKRLSIDILKRFMRKVAVEAAVVVGLPEILPECVLGLEVPQAGRGVPCFVDVLGLHVLESHESRQVVAHDAEQIRHDGNGDFAYVLSRHEQNDRRQQLGPRHQFRL